MIRKPAALCVTETSTSARQENQTSPFFVKSWDWIQFLLLNTSGNTEKASFALSLHKLITGAQIASTAVSLLRRLTSVQPSHNVVQPREGGRGEHDFSHYLWHVNFLIPFTSLQNMRPCHGAPTRRQRFSLSVTSC